MFSRSLSTSVPSRSNRKAAGAAGFTVRFYRNWPSSVISGRQARWDPATRRCRSIRSATRRPRTRGSAGRGDRSNGRSGPAIGAISGQRLRTMLAASSMVCSGVLVKSRSARNVRASRCVAIDSVRTRSIRRDERDAVHAIAQHRQREHGVDEDHPRLPDREALLLSAGQVKYRTTAIPTKPPITRSRVTRSGAQHRGGERAQLVGLERDPPARARRRKRRR